MTITRNRLRYRGKSSKLERRFELLWRILNGPELVREYQFHPERKWRVDFAHIPSRILIEIEGGIWIQGRHNRGAGFITDIEKYNEATFSGWRVFRFADVHLTIEMVQRLRDALVLEIPVAAKFSPADIASKKVLFDEIY